jgi:regulatory protein
MKPERDKPRRSAYAAALALLAAREHSKLQLTRKLVQREYSEEEISAALEALVNDGYLSDERAAAAKVASGLRRGHGPGRIRNDLREAGLSAGKQITADDGVEIDWVAHARALAERKFGGVPPADYSEWSKRARFLQARGYDSETIRKALPRS